MSAPFFGTSGITASASAFYDWAKVKLGSPKMNIEADYEAAVAALEEASNEFSMIVNTARAVDDWSNIRGQSLTADLTIKNPNITSLDFLRKIAKSYEDETPVGGDTNLEMAYLSWTANNQYQDVFTSTTAGYVCNLKYKDNSAVVADSVKIFNVLYSQTKQIYGFGYDPFYLIQREFGDYAVGIDGGMYYNYMYPLWGDMANASYLKTMHQFRTSQYQYLYAGRSLWLFPSPKSDMKIWVQFKKESSGLDEFDPFTNGVSSLGNAPFSNFDYALLNEISQDWIRKYAFECFKETLGRIRSKYSEVPIPNGTITLDGKELIQEAEDRKAKLIEWLEKKLEMMDTAKVLETDLEEAKSVNEQLKFIPLTIKRM